MQSFRGRGGPLVLVATAALVATLGRRSEESATFSISRSLFGLQQPPGARVAAESRVRRQATATLPDWKALKAAADALPACQKMAQEDAEKAAGRGPPHRASKLRLFSAKDESKIRVKFFRDSAAWCPYCQKLWMMLEEKEIPYRAELINMRSYGDKPWDFMLRVPGGMLPVVELDGKTYTESLKIMAMLDDVFTEDQGHRRMVPKMGTPEYKQAEQLLRLERYLFGAWCEYVFRGGSDGRRAFSEALGMVEDALGQTPGPWFLNSEGPMLVDLQYVSHIERMAASVPFWKGVAFRGTGNYPNIDRWFAAFEARPSYAASRSDWYTHVKDIPPQYGQGVPERGSQEIALALVGGDAAWHLPLPALSESTAWSDKLQPGWEAFEAAAPHEAAWRVLSNHDDVARFMARGAGQGGGWSRGRSDRAELADPYAQPNEALVPLSDAALRCAASILLDGARPTDDHAALVDNLAAQAGAQSKALAACCAYLRDRVGVPRDMSYPAARTLRASMNYLIDRLS